MPTQTTRTLNPLPFNALEPKRFEDLVRQLAYDFRRWRMLEATGRTGSDEGYDARGFEITTDDVDGDVEGQDDDEFDASSHRRQNLAHSVQTRACHRPREDAPAP